MVLLGVKPYPQEVQDIDSQLQPAGHFRAFVPRFSQGPWQPPNTAQVLPKQHPCM